VASTSTLAVSDLSPEVLAFAAEKGVSDCLPNVLEMTRRIFPSMFQKVTVEDDPEVSDNRQIIIYVNVGDMDGGRMFETSHRWGAELLRNCPKTHGHVFCLDQVHE
jgi:hypothetical protein